MPRSEHDRPESHAAAEAYIARLIEEMTEAAGGRQEDLPDADLDLVELRLAQLRDQPKDMPAGPDVPTLPPGTTRSRPASADPGPERGPAGARVVSETVDDVILAAAAAGELGPPRLVERAVSARSSRRLSVGYLVALVLAAVAGGWIGRDPSLVTSTAAMLESYWPGDPHWPTGVALPDAPAVPAGTEGMVDDIDNAGPPASEASVWRKVKTYRVDADGRVFGDDGSIADQAGDRP